MIEERREQILPTFSFAERERFKAFGTIVRFKKGEQLNTTGEPVAGMFVLLAGHVTVRERHGTVANDLTELGPGQFLAEIGQLTGQPALVDAIAADDVEAILIPTDRLRTLMITEPELGERLMRALILRRALLIETGAGGPLLIGRAGSAAIVRLQNFLLRNAFPHQLLDPEDHPEARQLLNQFGLKPDARPIVICPDGEVPHDPSEAEIARCIGVLRSCRGRPPRANASQPVPSPRSSMNQRCSGEAATTPLNGIAFATDPRPIRVRSDNACA